jgi:hypothetical protein
MGNNNMNIQYFDYPWKYAVVDDFLSQDTFNQIIEYSKIKGADTPVDTLGTYTFQEKGYENLRQDIISQAIKFKELTFDTLNTPQKDIESAAPTPYLHIREPGHNFSIHPDNWAKVFSLVLYLYPPKGQVGTEIYTATAPSEVAQFVTEVKWKPNRMLAFVPSHNPGTMTNHKVYNFTEVNRVALVVNWISGNKSNEFK